MKTRLASLVAAVVLAAAPGVFAQVQTPVGVWKTVDDETGQAKSHVRISDNAGVLSGRVDKLLDPSRQDSKCDKCSGALKDQPVLGMTILEGVRRNADEAYWDGGTILDPNNGKTYKVRLTPKDGGKALEVRGFIGPFYRNQQWVRVE
jgi:uncharacterized protein (DUF2147 family)